MKKTNGVFPASPRNDATLSVDLSNLEQIVEVYIEKRARFQKLPEKNDSNLREERQLALPADAACAAEGDPDASS